LLALTVSPVLCCLFLKNVQPRPDNILVRAIRGFYLWQLGWLLKLRWFALAGFVAVVVATGWVAAQVGREFMPELEEGNLYVRGTFPNNVSFDEASARTRELRRLLREYAEVEAIVPQVGRPDDGTDPCGYYNVEGLIILKPMKTWPVHPSLGRPR